jgi:cytochrome P450
VEFSGENTTATIKESVQLTSSSGRHPPDNRSRRREVTTGKPPGECDDVGYAAKSTTTASGLGLVAKKEKVVSMTRPEETGKPPTPTPGVDARNMVPGRAGGPNPHRAYAELLSQGDVAEPSPGAIIAVSRAAVDQVLKNHELYSSALHRRLGRDESQVSAAPLIPLNLDPPEHVKYRRLLDPLFAPKQIDGLEERIANRANRYIDAFIDRGECEFYGQFAVPFPSSIFVELMGLPSEDIDLLLTFKEGFIRQSGRPDGGQGGPASVWDEHVAYFTTALDERDQNPTDDLLTQFLQMEVDGNRLSRGEILNICRLFLMAGLDTVTDQLSTSFRDLAVDPALQRQIVDDPSVIPAAVEELLRWETVVPSMVRIATRETELFGRPVKAGQPVVFGLGSANLDPEEYDDPLAIRFDRGVNRHLAFGGGVHRCLGSHLARRELRIAMREWHRRIPRYGIKGGTEPEYPPGLRRVQNLWLSWSA